MDLRELIGFYTSTKVEANRLFEDVTQLERVRTQELVLRHLPPAPARILDIGGGMGFYSFWLAELGYEVTLVDIVPMHVKAVTANNNKAPVKLTGVTLNDARKLEAPPESYEAALLLGPLYHLTERADRLQALAEAHRILVPGGVLFAVGISRFASMLDGYRWGDVENPAFRGIMEGDLETGRHVNPTGDPGFFTNAHFHHPEELRVEVAEAGFGVEVLYSVESFGRYVPDFERTWSNPESREYLLETIRRVETDPALLGLTCHNMAVAVR